MLSRLLLLPAPVLSSSERTLGACAVPLASWKVDGRSQQVTIEVRGEGLRPG